MGALTIFMNKKLALLLVLGTLLITGGVLAIRYLNLARIVGLYISATIEPLFPGSPEKNTPNSSTYLASGSVLGLDNDFYRSLDQINFNLPAFFNDYVNITSTLTVGGNATLEKDATISGSLQVDQDLTVRGKRINFGTAAISGGNIITSLKAGSGISVTTGNAPSISNTGVLSLAGKTGALQLEEGENITIDGLKINADINSFQNIKVDGQSTLTAGGADDSVTFSPGPGLNITTNTNTKKVTLGILSSCSSGEVLKWNTSSGNWECGTDAGASGLGIINVKENNVVLSPTADTLDFKGSDFVLTESPAGEINIDIDYANSYIARKNTTETVNNLWTFTSGLTLSNLSTGIVHADSSGSLSSSALNLAGGSSLVTGVLPQSNGGTGFSSYTTGDILYASATDTLSRRSIGVNGQVLAVSGGVPVWSTVSGLCLPCIVTDPNATQTITPTVGTATGLTIAQASGGSVDVFDVTSNNGVTKYLQVDSLGNVSLSGNLTVNGTSALTGNILAGGTISGLTGLTSSGTITLSGLSTAGLVTNTSGGVLGTTSTIGAGYITADSLDFTELKDAMTLDASTDIAIAGSNVFSLTNTGTGNSFVVNDAAGDTTPFVVDASGNVGIGVASPTAALDITGDINLSGTVISNSGQALFKGGLQVQAAIVSNGDITLKPAGGGNTIFTSNGGSEIMRLLAAGNVGIGDSTPASMFTVGSGDLFQVNSSGNIVQIGGAANTIANTSGLTITAAATGLNLQPDGTVDVNLAGGSGATGCTVANATGNLTCSGSIVGSSSGTLGYWSRSGTTLTPATSNDILSISSNSSTAPVLSLVASGNVTSGNAAALDVQATGATTTVPAAMITNAGSGLSLVVNDNGSTTDTTPFVIDASGNVGIGVASPSKTFHLAGTMNQTMSSSSDQSTFSFTNTSGTEYTSGAQTAPYLFTDSRTFASGTVNEPQESMLYLDNASSNNYSLTSRGHSAFDTADLNVLKFMQSPTTVTYSGTPNFQFSYLLNSTDDNFLGLQLSGSDDVNNIPLFAIGDGDLSSVGSTFNDITDPTVAIYSSDEGDYMSMKVTTSGSSVFKLGTAAQTFSYDVAGSTVMTVGSNVGIGDSSPASMFTVGSGDLFQVNSSGAIAAATGITSSGTITLSGLSTAGLVTNTSGGVLGTTSTIGAGYITADSLDFTELKDAMTLDASTDIAIAGSNVFSLTNTGTGNSFVVNDAAGDTTPFVVDASGNVGIGVASPSNALDVTGNINASGYLKLAGLRVLDTVNAGSLLLGNYAGNSAVAGMDYNTLLGVYAGQSLNASSADSNTAVGYAALYNATTGKNNVAVGRDAGINLDTGSYNTFIGSIAGKGSTGATGSENVALGYQSLLNLSDGTANVMVGYSAGQTVTTGNYNTYLGSYTDSDDGTYSHSIALGDNAYIRGSNQLVVGSSSSSYVSNGYFGSGVVDTSPVGFTLQSTGGRGTDVNGANLTIAGGKGTGAGIGGSVIFSTSAAGSSGAALNSLSERMRIDSNGNVNVGGDTTPNNLFAVGSTSQFQVDSSGSIAAAAGITSSGSITFSGLSSGSASSTVCIDASNHLITCAIGGSMSGFTAAGDTGSSQAINDSNTLSILGGTNGIDTVASATDTLTLNLDTTEIGSTIFGSGSDLTWTFNGSGATDPTIGFGNNSLTFTANTNTFTSAQTTGTTTSSAFVFNANSLTTGTGLYLSSSSLTSGLLQSLSSTSTALTSGGLLSLDWSPASTTNATGDLLSLNIGSYGNIGNLFNIKDNNSSVFSVSETQITSALPQQFTAAGDVGIAYDLAFTNQTASFIKSNASLNLEAGESFESNNLSLTTFNSGSIILDTGATGSIDLLNATNFGSQQTLSVNDTTPDVSGSSSFITANTSGTVISDFDAGASGTLRAGQILFLEIADSNTDFDCTSSGLNCGSTDITRPAIGDMLTWFYNGTDWKLVSMMVQSVNHNDSTGEGFDLAEWYVGSESLSAGEVVSVDPDAPTEAYIKKSTSPRDAHVIGVVSTKPGITLGEPANSSAYQVALAGRIPVKVSTINGPIEKGDYLTSSSIPGVATKATIAGPTIGKALTSYSGSGVGEVTVFINISWYDPDAYLASLSGTTISANPASDNFSLTGASGNLISRIGLFSNAAAGNISAGAIDAKKISVDGQNILDLIKTAQPAQASIPSDKGLTQEDLNTILNNAYHLESASDTLIIKKKMVAYSSVNIQGDLQVSGQSFIKGKATFEEETVFNKLASFFSNVIFKGKVSFENQLTFNKDTAGIAIIEKNNDKVSVVFDKEYDAIPLVSATMVHEGDATSSAFLKSFYITQKNKQGFTIKLDSPQSEDVSFNWIAIAVNDPKISKSSDISSSPAPTVDPVVQEGVDKLMKEATKSAQIISSP